MKTYLCRWMCGTGILQPKFEHHPQESHSSSSDHAQGPSARQAIHSKIGQTKSSSLLTANSLPTISPSTKTKVSRRSTPCRWHWKFMSGGICLPCNVKGIRLKTFDLNTEVDSESLIGAGRVLHSLAPGF